jgi:hypothetical protein
MDMETKLTEQEKKFLGRVARRRRLFLLSSIATVVVAVSILVYRGLIMKDMNSSRFVIILLLLLSGRSYLRLYKCATIFGKLKQEPATEQGRG